MACLQFRPSTVAARIAFSIVFTKRSASPLALGQYGVILRCLKPKWLANFSNSSPLNGGQLSDLRISGMPCLENMASSFGIAAFADVVVRSKFRLPGIDCIHQSRLSGIRLLEMVQRNQLLHWSTLSLGAERVSVVLEVKTFLG